MNGLNGKPTEYPEMPLFPIRYFGSEQRRPGRNEDCIAAFQRLHSKSFHAEAL